MNLRIRLNPHPSTGFPSWGLTVESLRPDHFTSGLADAAVEQFTTDALGNIGVTLLLNRQQPYSDTLDEVVLRILQNLGYDALEAVVEKVADQAFEHALAGGIAGGGVGGAIVRDTGLALLLMAVGGASGFAHGKQSFRVIARYHARRVHPFGGGWEFTPLPLD